MNIHSLGHASQSHAHMWDRWYQFLSEDIQWKVREDLIASELASLRCRSISWAWGPYQNDRKRPSWSLKQTDLKANTRSLPRVNFHGWPQTMAGNHYTRRAPQTAATYSQQAGRNTKAIHRCHAGSLHAVQQEEKEKRTYVHPREPQICGYPLRSSSDMFICVSVSMNDEFTSTTGPSHTQSVSLSSSCTAPLGMVQ